MLNGIKSFIRKVGVAMGLIKELERLTDHKKIPLSEAFYSETQKWLALHKGYHAEMHDIKYYTIQDGQQTRTMASMNMPKVSTQEMASLIFNERCEISVSSKSDKNFDEFIQDVSNKTSLTATSKSS